MSGPVKAFLEPEVGERITCLFNPAELRIAKANSWSAPAVPRRNAPNLEFQHGDSGTLSMSLTLDTTDTGQAVTKHTDQLLGLMKVNADLGDNSDPKVKAGRPPWVRFHWGELYSFKAAITSLNINFTYFSSDGKPLRAAVQLELKQYEDEGKWPLQNPTSGTPEVHRVHMVKAGETLDRIAAEHYGDPARWRLIAEANRVLDPLSLPPGTPLRIPEIEAVARA
ncbi:MAG: LysM peptidoglycan-binding domain-containing protein [Dehalococcoidia bacterium]